MPAISALRVDKSMGSARNLIVVEPQPSCTELLSKNPIPLTKVVNGWQLMLVHPTVDGDQ
jgi:hypothetical protein